MLGTSNSPSIEARPLENPTDSGSCAKVYRNKSFQSNLLAFAIFLLFVSFFLLMNGTVGQVSRSGRYHDPIPALVPWGIAAAALCLAFAAAGVWLQYYYVVDFQGRCLRNQFKFFGLQRDTVVLRSQDIVGITTQGEVQLKLTKPL